MTNTSLGETTTSKQIEKFDVVARYFYHDKVSFWLKRRLTREEVNAVRARSGGFRRNKVTKDKANFMKRLGWRRCYSLFQPTNAALEYLAKLLGRDVLINYVELAFDAVTKDQTEARRLAKYLETHQWQRHRSRKQTSRNYDGTIYSGDRSARNRTACYDDRHSKITGEVHCCHIEWRISRADPVRAKGVATFDDLLGFDHLDFWKRHLALACIDMGKLEVACQRRNRRRSHRQHAAAHLVVRNASYNGLGDSAAYKALCAVQDVRAGWRYPTQLKNYLVPIPNRHVLGC